MQAVVTITAVDRVSNVVKTISSSIKGISAATDNMSKSWSRMAQAGDDVLTRVRNFSLIALASGGAIFGLTKHFAEYGEELGLASQKTGVAVSNLQKLQYVAKLNNVETEGLNTSLKFLNKNLVEAATNPASSAAAAFSSMGISVRDSNGQIKDANSVMLEMGDKFKNAADGPKKVATALVTMGRQGTSMIPILNMGTDAILKQEEELAKLGHLWSQPELDQAGEFANQYKRLTVAIEGVASVIAINLMPVIEPIIGYMTEWIAVNKQWLADNIKQDVILFASGLKQVWLSLMNIASTIVRVANALGGFKNILLLFAGVYVAKFVVSVGQLVASIFGFIRVFSVMSAALLASPITWIIGGVVLLGVAIYEVAKNWDFVKASMVSALTTVKPYFETYANIVTLGMYSVVKSIYNNWSKIGTYLEEVWSGFPATASRYLSQVFTAVIGAFSPILPYVTSIWDGVKTYFSTVLNGILGLFGTNLDALEAKLNNVLDSMKSGLLSFADAIYTPFKPILAMFEGIYSGVVGVKNAITGTPSVPDMQSTGNVITPLVANTLALDHPSNMAKPSILNAGSQTTTNLTNNFQSAQNQTIDINMLINYEGRPTKVTARSPSPINFTASVGKMV